jgi:anti-sigma-K factor RskA
MPILAAQYGTAEEIEGWDDSKVGDRIFARIAVQETNTDRDRSESAAATHLNLSPWHRSPTWWVLGTAATACLVVGVSLVSYRAGRHAESAIRQLDTASLARAESLAKDKENLSELLSVDALRLAQLEVESSRQRGEIEHQRSALQAAEVLANENSVSKNGSEEQRRAALQERDALAAKLQDMQQSYGELQARLATLRAENKEVTARAASLQKEVEGLSATNQEQQQRIGSEDQYLSADRDIRELMGARQLYIADVFDVSSDSRRRKPYGRIFYTKGKSLIFYAFDLDQQTRVKNAASFQAWGKSESGASKPVSLGILYLDNEANRRWALRCDAPEQLAQIDAVFVTVEPHGGSEKPTGKAFLYASLRKEPNHP